MKLPLLPVEQHAQNTPTCIHWVDIMVPVYVDFFSYSSQRDKSAKVYEGNESKKV